MQSRTKKKKKWYWYGWASCLSYWIARAIYKTVTCSKIRCFKLWESIDFFQRALYFTESILSFKYNPNLSFASPLLSIDWDQSIILLNLKAE